MKTVVDILNKYKFVLVFVSKTILSIMPAPTNKFAEDLLIHEINEHSQLSNKELDYISLQYFPEKQNKEDKFVTNIKNKDLLPKEMLKELQKYYSKNNCTFVTHNNLDNDNCDCHKKG